MIIDCISDLHNHYPKLEGGDLLILAGDYTASDKLTQWAEFFSWLKEQKYRKKVFVAGNHDGFLENAYPKNEKESEDLKEVQSFLEQCGEGIESDFEYLCDSGTEFEGLKIWGTPWSLWFQGINPKCTSFTGHESDLEKKHTSIPNDTDILISHTPFSHMLDANIDGYHCGSYSLRDAVDRVKPRLFVCGHIHEQGGQMILYKHQGTNTICINTSHVNERYEPVNKPVRIIL